MQQALVTTVRSEQEHGGFLEEQLRDDETDRLRAVYDALQGDLHF